MPTNDLGVLRKGVFTKEDTFYIAVGSEWLRKNSTYSQTFVPAWS